MISVRGGIQSQIHKSRECCNGHVWKEGKRGGVGQRVQFSGRVIEFWGSDYNVVIMINHTEVHI